MDSPLSQHKKRSLPSDIRYFPLTILLPLHWPTSGLVETRQPIKEHNIMPEKAGVKV